MLCSLTGVLRLTPRKWSWLCSHNMAVQVYSDLEIIVWFFLYFKNFVKHGVSKFIVYGKLSFLLLLQDYVRSEIKTYLFIQVIRILNKSSLFSRDMISESVRSCLKVESLGVLSSGNGTEHLSVEGTWLASSDLQLYLLQGSAHGVFQNKKEDRSLDLLCRIIFVCVTCDWHFKFTRK